MPVTLRFPGAIAWAAPLLLMAQAPGLEGPGLAVRAGVQEAWVEGTVARVRTRWTLVNEGKVPVQGSIHLPTGGDAVTRRVGLGSGAASEDPGPVQPLASLPPGGTLAVDLLHVQRLAFREGRWHLELAPPPRLAAEATVADVRWEVQVRMPLPVQEVDCTSHSPVVTRLAEGAFQVRVHPRDRAGLSRPLHLAFGMGSGDLQAGAIAQDGGSRMAVVVQGSRGPRVPRDLLWIVDPRLLIGGRQACVALLRTLLWQLEADDEVILVIPGNGRAMRLASGPTGTGYQRLRRALETAPAGGDAGDLKTDAALAEVPARRRGRVRTLLLGVGPGADVPGGLRTAREGEDCWVVHPGAAPAWAQTWVSAGGWRSLSLEDPETGVAQILDPRRAPRLVDLRLSGKAEGAGEILIAQAGILASHRPWVYEGPAVAGPLQVEGWAGDAVHRWTLDPAGRHPGSPALAWPGPRALADGDARPPADLPKPGNHVHGADAPPQAPFLCTLRASHEGLPPADLRARLESVLLSPAHRRALRRTQHADFTVRLQVSGEGTVKGVEIQPALADRSLQAGLVRALKAVKLPGWDGEGSRVELPVHAH